MHTTTDPLALLKDRARRRRQKDRGGGMNGGPLRRSATIDVLQAPANGRSAPIMMSRIPTMRAQSSHGRALRQGRSGRQRLPTGKQAGLRPSRSEPVDLSQLATRNQRQPQPQETSSQPSRQQLSRLKSRITKQNSEHHRLRQELEHWKQKAANLQKQASALALGSPINNGRRRLSRSTSTPDNRHPKKSHGGDNNIFTSNVLQQQHAQVAERWAQFQVALRQHPASSLLEEMLNPPPLNENLRLEPASASAADDDDMDTGRVRESAIEAAEESFLEHSIDYYENEHEHKHSSKTQKTEDELEHQVQTAQSSLERASAELMEHQDLLSYEHEAEKSALLDEIAEKDRAIQRALHKLSVEKKKVRKLTGDKQALRSEVTRLKEHLLERDKDMRAKQSSIGRMKRDLNNAAHHQQENARLSRVIEERSTEVARLERQNNLVQQELATTALALSEAEHRITVLQAVRDENERLHHQIRRLQQQQQQQQHQQQPNHNLPDTLTRQKPRRIANAAFERVVRRRQRSRPSHKAAATNATTTDEYDDDQFEDDEEDEEKNIDALKKSGVDGRGSRAKRASRLETYSMPNLSAIGRKSSGAKKHHTRKQWK